MAAVTSITITNRTPRGATITFGGGNDFNGTQISQLVQVLTKLSVECGGVMPTDTSATVTGI